MGMVQFKKSPPDLSDLDVHVPGTLPYFYSVRLFPGAFILNLKLSSISGLRNIYKGRF